jgi:hypothetical protein
VLQGALAATKANGQPDWLTRLSAARTLAVLPAQQPTPQQDEQPPVSIVVYDLPSGAEPVLVRHRAAAGVNGDGKSDLVTANFDANTVSVLMNKGDGTFQGKLDYRTGRRSESVAIADVDGDGKPDLVTANRSDTVSVLINRADGSFEARVDYRAGSGPRAVAIGDLNGDGKLDLATANANVGVSSVSVFVSRGDGTFRARRDYAVDEGSGSVAIGDLNGDGKVDLATANEVAGTVSVLINNGDGSFNGRREYRPRPPTVRGRHRRLERRPQARPGQRERAQHRLRAPQHDTALHSAEGHGKTPVRCQTRDRARALPRREHPTS